MRKMNKIVALSLVLAMALSMMASAVSFKDNAAINEDLIDEINLLVALGVYSENGTGAGYFEPNGTITRSQAAKIIYVLKNKGVDNGATSWTGLNIFSDVEAGAWYEGYVNYCASTGILAGTGDGKYNPNGQLTGVELAKMLLVVIGYKADVEGYTGNAWDANILADAEAAGLFVDYELPVRGVITREWAAKMIVNALYATKVRYADGELVEMYDIYNNPVKYAEQDLGLVETVGTLIATPNVKLGEGAINEEGENKTSTIYTNTNVVINYAASEALLGQKVTVLSKGALSSTAKVYGVTAHKDVKVVDTTVDALSVSKVDEDEIKVKVAGVEKTIPETTTINVYVDFGTKTAKTWGSVSNGTLTKTAMFDGLTAGANDGRAVKLIDNNDDGIYDVALVGSVVYGEVGYINAANHTFRVTGGLSVTEEEVYDKLVFVDTVAKDDIIKITKDVMSGVEKTVIEKVDVVTGAISKVVNATTAVIDGVEYKLAAKEIISASDYAFATDTKAQDYFVDGKYIVYTAAIGATGAESQTNIAYVIAKKVVEDSWTGVKTNKIEVLKNDGTREILTYDNNIDNAIPFSYITPNAVAEYVMKDGKIALVLLEGNGIGTVQATTKNEGKNFDKSANKFFSGNTTYLVNDETYFFVVDLSKGNTADNKYSVVKASELNGDMTARAVKFAFAHEGMPYLYFAVLEGAKPGADASEGIAIAAGTVNEIRDGSTKIFTLEVTKLDGTVVTLKAKSDIFTAVKYQIVDFEIGNDGYATVAKWDISDASYVADAVVYADGNALMLDDLGYVELASDAKVYYVDAYKSGTSDRIMVSEGTIAEAAEVSESVLAENVLYKLNTSNKISHLIVEVDGEAIVNFAE